MSCRFPPGCLALRALSQEKAGEGLWRGWAWGQSESCSVPVANWPGASHT